MIYQKYIVYILIKKIKFYFKRIEKGAGNMAETLSEKAYNIIKERLLYTKKGSYLSIRKVAEELNMSYTPVREAFLRLHKEGFLELVPKVGFFTNCIDINEILQIYEVRECIELFVFKKIFNSIGPKHIELLKKYLEEQKNCLDKKDIHGYVKADQKFHEVFLEIYNNQYLSNLYRNIREQYFICSNNIAERHSGVAVEEHERLIKCIENKDFEKAINLLSMHIENAKQRVKDGFRRVS